MELERLLTVDNELTTKQWLDIINKAKKLTPISIIELAKDNKTIFIQFWSSVLPDHPILGYTKEANEKAKSLLISLIESEIKAFNE